MLLRPRISPLLRWIRTVDSGPRLETERDFLPCDVFYRQMRDCGLDFFTGVPDSLLKDICGYIADKHPKEKHIIAANEGSAIAIGAGYHMATRKFPVIYLQNSGLGNIINPMLSLVDSRVFKIPMLLLIGWRGEPGKKDEPQHLVQGKVMSSMMTELGIPYEVLPDYEEGASAALNVALYHLNKRSSPYAFLVRRQCFLEYKIQNPVKHQFPLSREEAINETVKYIGKFDPIVSTTGFASRELYESRSSNQRQQDFYCVGSMGHASSISMGIAIAKPSKTVYCLDGDGAFIMHMGAAAQIGPRDLPNFRHIVFNNGAHDSVGGQPTVACEIDLPGIANACGYRTVNTAQTPEEIASAFQNMSNSDGPHFLEIKVTRNTRKNLGRPKENPKDNKTKYMRFLDL